MPTTPRPLPVWGGRTLVLVGIILVAINLRTAVAALSPIFDGIDADVPLDNLGIGLLGTLPPLFFAIFGLLAPVLRRRMHLETLLLASLVAMTVAHLWRGASDTFLSLALGSAVAFAGAGVANVVLPPIVKKYFPDRIGGVTSVYVTVMTLFSMVPALVAVPVAQSFGWRVSVAMWAALGVLAVFPWIALWLRERRVAMAEAELPDAGDVASPALVGSVWGSPLGWALAVFFGMTSINVFGAFAWLPQILTDIAGTSPGEAGALLALYAAMGVPLAVIIPVLAVRRGTTRPLIITGAALYVIGYLGLLIVPGTATWLWVLLAGLGPLLFPLTLVLINLRTRTPHGAIALSGFAQGVGYLIGSLGPLLLGVLHELTGGWTVPILFLLSTVVGVAVSGVVLLRPRMLEDEWDGR
ncbi:MAG TPA: MFS transporter [Homoserinimonas sp.]|nr:MFS transporter [Homoserinimonas sp.]